MTKTTRRVLAIGTLLTGVALLPLAATAQTKVIKVQASWPSSGTVYEHLTDFVKRADAVFGGRIKFEPLPAGQIVPAFEVLDATHKKVIDGAHTWPGYWVGKNKVAILFTGGPGGPFGMDHMDYMSWMWWGGGLDKFQRFYRETLKLNVVSFPAFSASPQALGWFKKPIDSLADFKGTKCRQTGIAAEIFNEMGMRTVNMPAGEIMPAAERGTIDCAELVGGIEDMRYGMHMVWKHHYAPSLHESVSFGELMFNGDVWKELAPADQETIKSLIIETMFTWWARWQRMNAEAVIEMRDKHKIELKLTPVAVHKELLDAWERIAQKEGEKNPLFKEIYDDLKKWASVSVPVKNFYFPSYSIAADYYWKGQSK